MLLAAHLPLLFYLAQNFTQPCDKAARKNFGVVFHVFYLSGLCGLPSVVFHAFVGFKQGVDDNAPQNAGNGVTTQDAIGKGAIPGRDHERFIIKFRTL